MKYLFRNAYSCHSRGKGDMDVHTDLPVPPNAGNILIFHDQPEIKTTENHTSLSLAYKHFSCSTPAKVRNYVDF